MTPLTKTAPRVIAWMCAAHVASMAGFSTYATLLPRLQDEWDTSVVKKNELHLLRADSSVVRPTPAAPEGDGARDGMKFAVFHMSTARQPIANVT